MGKMVGSLANKMIGLWADGALLTSPFSYVVLSRVQWSEEVLCLWRRASDFVCMCMCVCTCMHVNACMHEHVCAEVNDKLFTPPHAHQLIR